ncbi:hypothetical protein DKG34_29725 [Streptomyces sp. NWU49]|nr:hypothetical protein DKG34_29725 [Streptomyces sp. NWU49]
MDAGVRHEQDPARSMPVRHPRPTLHPLRLSGEPAGRKPCAGSAVSTSLTSPTGWCRRGPAGTPPPCGNHRP